MTLLSKGSHSPISEPKSWGEKGWTPPKQPLFFVGKLGFKMLWRVSCTTLKQPQLGADQCFGWTEDFCWTELHPGFANPLETIEEIINRNMFDSQFSASVGQSLMFH